jgi:hypothetical protein
MRKNSAGKYERAKGSRRSYRRLFFFIIVAVVVGVTPIIVISRQKPFAKESKAAANETVRVNKVSATNNRTYVTRHIDGQEIQIDTQTGEIKPLTAQEAEKLAAGLKPMLDQSTEGLVQMRRTDGSVSMNLEGRFQNVTVARINKDGTISQSCVDNPRAAGKFFGIDPKLIENAPTGRTKPIQN